MSTGTDKLLARIDRNEARHEARQFINDAYGNAVHTFADLLMVLIEGVKYPDDVELTQRDFVESVQSRLKNFWEWTEGDMQLLETMANAIEWVGEDE